LTQNKDVQFSDRKIIAIGHSMGAVSLFVSSSLSYVLPVNFSSRTLDCRALTQTYPHPPTFAHLVLCEPMIAPTDVPKDDPKFRVGGVMIAAAESRRDIWPSMKDAFKTLKSRKAFAGWDDEVLRIYVVFGSRPWPFV
jgi:hypothetical protein